MPEDIYGGLWAQIMSIVQSGVVGVTPEIYEELKYLPGDVGKCIVDNADKLVMEVGQDTWNWPEYVAHCTRCQDVYKDHIAEYNGGSPKMICLNDLTIICLAKTLGLSVVSQETEIFQGPKKRIPNICRYENVTHLWFNDFLRAEGIRI